MPYIAVTWADFAQIGRPDDCANTTCVLCDPELVA